MYTIGSLEKDLQEIGALGNNAIITNITTNTTTAVATIDRQGARRVPFTAFTGTVTDGDYEFKLFHGDDSGMSDEAEVSSDDYLGAIPNWTADTDDDKIETFEYCGSKRYLRLKIVSANITSGAYAGAVVHKGILDHPPKAEHHPDYS